MKKILTLILTIILGVSAVGCNLTSKEVKIISGNSLDGISISKLIKEENEIKKGYNTTYNIENNKEKLEKSLDNEKYDIAIVPTDMATKVYNKNSNYQICASIGEGSYYLVTSDPTITGFNSTLINKDVAIIEKNSMIDIISKSILNKNNIDDSKVNFKYVSSAPEIVTTLALGNIRTGIVPETSLTTLLYKHSGLKILTSTNEAYEKAFNIKEGYSQFSIIVKKDFAKDNKEYVNEFLSKAIKRCNLKFIIVDEFKNNYKELFNILYNYNKEAVGGTVIDESIYYK